jgi:hypothetical protein
MPIRLLVPVAAVLAGAGLAGCGGATDPMPTVTRATETSRADSYIGNVTATGAAALGARPAQRLHGVGAFDSNRRLAFERVDLPGPLDANKVPPRAYLVFAPRRILVIPAAGSPLPPGKKVISVALPARAETDPHAARFVQQAMGLNPQLQLDQILWGGTSAAETGSETLDHVPYTDYRVQVDLRRALARAQGPFARAERTAIRHELAALGQSRHVVPVDVRIDSAGYVRRLRTTVPGSGLGALAMDLATYGATFKPSFPPASQVVGFGALEASTAWAPQSPWRLAGN